MNADDPRQNHLLAALPAAELAQLEADLKLVLLPVGEVLYSSDSRATQVYFPTSAIISLLCRQESGASAIIAVVGSEGVTGVSLFMGGETTPSSAVVQSAGHAYRLTGNLLQHEFTRAGAMQQLLMRYTQSLLTQMTQTAVCSCQHPLDQQLCRWLLLSLDRLPSNQLIMTQDLIPSMLGEHREEVIEAAHLLQAAGLIQYTRGAITVLDRRGLEARTCECYAVVKSDTDRMLATLASD